MGLLACVLVPHQSVAERIATQILILIKGKPCFVSHLLKFLTSLPISQSKPRFSNWPEGLTCVPSSLPAWHHFLLFFSSFTLCPPSVAGILAAPHVRHSAALAGFVLSLCQAWECCPATRWLTTPSRLYSDISVRPCLTTLFNTVTAPPYTPSPSASPP